jgi:hypothetical protein
MNIEFLKSDDTVTFRVSNFSNPIEDALRMCFYEKIDDAYIKRFPASTPYLDKIMAHYEKYAEEMFLQLVYQHPIPWEKGLLEFARRVSHSDVDWWLTGSCAACIRGVRMSPHDVDIMVDSRCVALITDLFRDNIIEPIIDTNGWLTKDFGVLFLHCRIDIASDPQGSLDEPEPVDCGPYAKSRLESIAWNGYNVRIPPIELQLNVNRRRQRTERVELIEEYMSTHKT